MEDLLNEEEFIKPKNNPWTLFRRFYLFAIVQVVVLQLGTSFLFTDVNVLLMILVYIVLPVVTVVWMFTSTTQNFLLERKVKILAIVYLVSCFLVTNFLINVGKIAFKQTQNAFLTVDLWAQFMAAVFFFFIQLGLSLLVIRVVSRLIKKKLQQV
jgi:uncharacterized membrane protein